MPIVEITDNDFGDDEPDQTPIVLIRDSTTDSTLIAILESTGAGELESRSRFQRDGLC